MRIPWAVALALLWIGDAHAELPKIKVSADRSGFVTDQGARFVPVGVNYYRPDTGWAPQLWKRFDADATRRDFNLLRAHGVNVVRVFLTAGSFYSRAGSLEQEGLEKFDRFLAIAESAGIYVHPTGPEYWEGVPLWAGDDPIAADGALEAREQFWRLFAARYRGRPTIFAYDLANEPHVGWNTPSMRTAWQVQHPDVPVPDPKDPAAAPLLLEFQHLREQMADRWTRRQAAAIRAADPAALVTVGLVQWSVPAIPMPLPHYSAFNPQRQAPFLDFIEIHFYPLAGGVYQYQSDDARSANLAYVESILREAARPGLPVVLAEFGWYGGGEAPLGAGKTASATEQQQADWCEQVVRTSRPLACGFLNWGMFDTPAANDVSRFTGLFTKDGQEKAWGERFATLAADWKAKPPQRVKISDRPNFPWEECLVRIEAAEEFRTAYLKAYVVAEAKHTPQ